MLESYNSHDDLSNRVCVPNKTENLNVHVFNLINQKFQQKTYYAINKVNTIEQSLGHPNLISLNSAPELSQITESITMSLDVILPILGNHQW